ncbi:hypothetical protein [Mucilaginibacter ginsenosidivorax]|uniref:Phage tail tape measure protein n=1 Tax=Mucilaginibacter ginsenosidivorax TaxID=862126 RepID=A0A5B8W7X1_9SPHI|nr:hypothetical protein [Mucilaginibacter ginsenosidivorax]QEC79056.1 hypothetical protein FSB76_25035 [Mucilaginibacter ginsenosidivorax]
MDDFKQQIQQTQASADALNVTLQNLYQKWGDLKKQQADFTEAGKTNTKYFDTITLLIDKYKGKIDDTNNSLTTFNTVLGQQERAFAAAQNRAEIWGKAWENAKTGVDKVTQSTETFGKILGKSADDFKPLTESLKTAVTVISPFKDAIVKANQAYTTYKESMASNNDRLEALKNVFPGLKKGVEEGAGGFRTFKVALAETGIGLILIVVAALIEKIQTVKPIMDVVNGAFASVSAVIKIATDTIFNLVTSFKDLGNFIAHPIDSIKKLGTTMADAAVDAYKLVQAQEKLKIDTSVQDAANDKIKDNMDLLKEQATNQKLTTAERKKALKDLQLAQAEYHNQNKALSNREMANNIEKVRIDKSLRADEIKGLKENGVAYAGELLKKGRIEQQQFDDIKKASDNQRKLRKEDLQQTKEYVDDLQKLKDEAAEKDKQRQDKQKAINDKLKSDKKSATERAKELNEAAITHQLQMTYDAYGNETLAAKDHYDKQLNELKELFKNKLIDQTLYNTASKNLQIEYHSNLGLIIKKYNDEDKAKTEQAEKELADIKIKGMAEGAEKQKKILEQQKDESTSQITKDNKEIAAQQQELQKQIDDAKKTNPQADVAELQTQLKAKQELFKLNGEKLTEIETQTQKEIAKIDQEAAQKEKLKKDQDNIDDDQSKVDNANSPSAKLAAQKKLIWDQAQYEIDAANGNSEEILKIETKRNNAIADLDKQSRKQRQDQEIQMAQQISAKAFSLISNSIKSSSEAKIQALESDKAKELSNTNLTKSQKAAIEAKYKKKENDEKVKAFKAEQKLQIAQALINGAVSVTKTLSTTGLPAAIPLIAADVAMTAIQIATIASQKPPKFARGGQFISDGRGALLPGYSRTDNTNAYLRSGEAVVVSEAMRNPWARNLVSAINVAHGGRDFSAPNPGNGYAIGGIFTDGGNANRYYNQPVNDVKELANTVAYQMINNFPPIYVDVKDVNNQQNILAQTVDRVNL